MSIRQIRVHCELGPDAERLLERAMQQQGLTARAHDRILKVARTIADLEGAERLAVSHSLKLSSTALWTAVIGLNARSTADAVICVT